MKKLIAVSALILVAGSLLCGCAQQCYGRQAPPPVMHQQSANPYVR